MKSKKSYLIIILTFLFIIILMDINNMKAKNTLTKNNLDTATFAGGCFWCTESAFLDLNGVLSVTSGYTGGKIPNPTYEQVSSGITGHYEAVQIVFDQSIISYSELIDIFWKQIDPTDDGGSFFDRGSQYLSAIFYHSNEQKLIAEATKSIIEKSGIFDKPVATKILPATTFYKAEEYHQQYCKKNPVRYYSYRSASGRDKFIKSIWGKFEDKYKKPEASEQRKNLNSMQYKVSIECGTEPPFNNEYWNHKEEGIYVDINSGEPLFSSKDKFDSGTGWPSFVKPIDARYIIKQQDTTHGMNRIEVKSKIGNSHLGHLFDDGPSSTNLRYCINSASLKFIPKNKMEDAGYGYLLWLFNK